jgi:hypothetical protein
MVDVAMSQLISSLRIPGCSLALVAILLPHGAVLPQDALRKEMRHIAGASERALRDFAMYRSVVRNREAMHVETAQTCVVSTFLHPLT